MSDIDRHPARIAATQHSLVTLDDIAGVLAEDDSRDPARVRAAAREYAATRFAAGRFERFATGRVERGASAVYRIAGVPWTYEARVLALIFAAGDGACASHMCAARLHGCGFATAVPEVSIPRGAHHRPEGARVHTSTDLDRCRIVRLNGIPTTDAARTMLDLGRFVGPQALRRAVEDARRRELVDWSGIARCLAAHARPGRHGVRRLRDVIAEGAVNDSITDTDSELIALSLLREFGFEEPVLQHRVYSDDGLELLAEMDFAYLDRLVNFEIDGDVHLHPEQRAKDEARDLDLRGRGWTVERIWWEVPVRRPKEFVRRVRQTLKEAADRSARQT